MAQRSRLRGLRVARDAYLRADYDGCLEALRGTKSIERDFLSARAYLRMGKPQEAERVLAASRASHGSQWHSLMAAASSRQGDTPRADGLVSRALDLAENSTERCEARYQLALLRWLELRRDEASAVLAEDDFGTEAALAEELRGWIAVARADYSSAVTYFESAAKLASGDVMLECNVLRTASTFAREIYLPAVMSRVLHRVEGVAWTPYLKVQRFYITRAAAWFEAIEGRYAEAMRQFRALARLDIGAPWQLYPICDQAYLSLALGEEMNGWAFADEALTLANHIDWESCSGSERVSLLYVANIFALSRPPEAQRLWALYKAAASPTSAMERAAMAAEPSLDAWEAYTAGLVEKGAGNAAAATAHFNRAYSIYRKIGFEWRAALTLMAQRDIAPDSAYDEYIESVLKRFPNSWLRRLADHQRHGPVSVSSIA